MILPLIPFVFHCISRRNLVGVGVETLSRDHFDVAGSLKLLRHQKGDLTSRESSEALAIDSVGRQSAREEATSILTSPSLSSYKVNLITLRLICGVD